MSKDRATQIFQQLKVHENSPSISYIMGCLRENPNATPKQILQQFKSGTGMRTPRPTGGGAASGGGGGAATAAIRPPLPPVDPSVSRQISSRYRSRPDGVSPLTANFHQFVPNQTATCTECDKPATHGTKCALHKSPQQKPRQTKRPKRKKSK